MYYVVKNTYSMYFVTLIDIIYVDFYIHILYILSDWGETIILCLGRILKHEPPLKMT